MSTIREILTSVYEAGSRHRENYDQQETILENAAVELEMKNGRAWVEAELGGRLNEHKVISDILTNEELAALSPATIRRLKERREELKRLRKTGEER